MEESWGVDYQSYECLQMSWMTRAAKDKKKLPEVLGRSVVVVLIDPYGPYPADV